MKTILSFNGSRFFEEKSPAVLNQIALTLMYFSEGQEEEKVKFSIEAEEKTREAISSFLKNHGLKSFRYLDPYKIVDLLTPLDGFDEVPLDDEFSKTPSKIRPTSQSFDDPIFSSPSISSSPSKTPDSQKSYAEKVRHLRNELTQKSGQKFSFFHLDQDDKYDGGSIVEGAHESKNCCFIVTNINSAQETKGMLEAAAKQIGLKDHADKLLNKLKGNKKLIFNGKNNKDLLKDLAAIRFLLQTSYEIEKLKILAIAFLENYDTYLKKEQRESLIILIQLKLENSFVTRNVKTNKQWQSDREIMISLAKNQGMDIAKLAYIAHNLFPYFPVTLKEKFLNNTLDEKNIDNLLEKEIKSKDEKAKASPDTKQLPTTVRTELLSVIQKQIFSQSSIFFQIPIIGGVLRWVASKFTNHNYSFKQMAYPSVGIYTKPNPVSLPRFIPFFNNSSTNIRYRKPNQSQSRNLLFDTYLPNLPIKDRNTLKTHTNIFRK